MISIEIIGVSRCDSGSEMEIRFTSISRCDSGLLLNDLAISKDADILLLFHLRKAVREVRRLNLVRWERWAVATWRLWQRERLPTLLLLLLLFLLSFLLLIRLCCGMEILQNATQIDARTAPTLLNLRPADIHHILMHDRLRLERDDLQRHDIFHLFIRQTQNALQRLTNRAIMMEVEVAILVLQNNLVRIVVAAPDIEVLPVVNGDRSQKVQLTGDTAVNNNLGKEVQLLIASRHGWVCLSIAPIISSNFLEKGLKTFISLLIRMGLINNDVYTASNGVQKTGAYICFANETLYLTQQGTFAAGLPSGDAEASSEPLYHVRANYRVFWDKDARESGKGFIDLQSVSTTVPSSQLSSSLYERLYDVLKQTYPNSVDELTVRAPPAPPAAPSVPVPVPAESAPAASEPSAPAESAAPSEPVQ